MKKILLALLPVFLVLGCAKNENVDHSSTQKSSAASIFALDSRWQTHTGKEIALSELKGKNLVVVMIFTRCQTACPMLVADMKNIKSRLSESQLKTTSLVLVSVDPEYDTPEVLRSYADNLNMSDAPWVFLRSDTEARVCQCPGREVQKNLTHRIFALKHREYFQ